MIATLDHFATTDFLHHFYKTGSSLTEVLALQKATNKKRLHAFLTNKIRLKV